MPARDDLIERNAALLQQGERLILTLDTETYVRPIAGQRASVGSHFRHCLDFYERFLEGLGPRRIDYDLRKRDPEEEREPGRALARLQRVVIALREQEPPGDEIALQVRAEARGMRESGWHASTPGRELQFLLSHTVHHYAIVALVLRGWGRAVPETFGVAPSTLEHWGSR